VPTTLLIEPYGKQHYAGLVALRNRVLRVPLGLTLDPAGDEHCTFYVAVEHGEVVGTVQRDGERLRQMAIAPERQKRGIGEQLVRLLEDDARQHGIARIELHARESAVGFYARLGYAAEGPTFTEVTVPHVVMRKSL
jgi:ribosomal protein S18 acetylase RimI-like enzyme